MQKKSLLQVVSSPDTARPAVLEGRWMGDAAWQTWLAIHPASVLEGDFEAFEEFPRWIERNALQFPKGAAIGFISYETARHFEAVPLARDNSLPDISFAYYPSLQVMPYEVPASCHESSPRKVAFSTNFDSLSYRAAFARIKSYITDGDIYQANLTQRFTAGLHETTAEEVFHRIRPNHAPFRAFLKSPSRTIVSNSPERFFKVTGSQILASPVKGTMARTRGDDGIKLQASMKDRAENVMIVDLLRNDLGRICAWNSIAVRLWETEPLPHLLHLVSHTSGTLRRGVGIREILRALFPCGSITGAPKIRAMQILSEVEKVPRGISIGAIGLIRGTPGSDSCTMDFNVAIRTLCIRDRQATFHAGGGVVADSKEGDEYAELMLKAQPLLEALAAGDSSGDADSYPWTS